MKPRTIEKTIDGLETKINYLQNNCIVIEITDDIEQVKQNTMAYLNKTLNRNYLLQHGLIKEFVIEKLLEELLNEYKTVGVNNKDLKYNIKKNFTFVLPLGKEAILIEHIKEYCYIHKKNSYQCLYIISMIEKEQKNETNSK